ncbi:hypothetical protein GGR51DRAFT_521307 [Nemania sp. FL0031]|nr:hypothetical protein GGR51DRAFT_521307 [Nemania sp. FL0031]
MNTTLLSDTLFWPSQLVLASFYALQNLTLPPLLYIAKILQHAETWTLSAFDAPTHTIYRMFPPEDISHYTRDDAQLGALVWLTVLVFCNVRGYLGSHPPWKTDDLDNFPRLIRALFLGYRIIKYVFSYLKIPFIIAYFNALHDQFETDGDLYLKCLRWAIIVILIAI